MSQPPWPRSDEVSQFSMGRVKGGQIYLMLRFNEGGVIDLYQLKSNCMQLQSYDFQQVSPGRVRS